MSASSSVRAPVSAASSCHHCVHDGIIAQCAHATPLVRPLEARRLIPHETAITIVSVRMPLVLTSSGTLRGFGGHAYDEFQTKVAVPYLFRMPMENNVHCLDVSIDFAGPLGHGSDAFTFVFANAHGSYEDGGRWRKVLVFVTKNRTLATGERVKFELTLRWDMEYYRVYVKSLRRCVFPRTSAHAALPPRHEHAPKRQRTH